MPVEAPSEIRAPTGSSELYEGKQVVVAHGLESDFKGIEVNNDGEDGKYPCYTPQVPAVGHDPPEVVGFSRSRKSLYLIIGVAIVIIVVAASIAVGVLVSRHKSYDKPHTNIAANASSSTSALKPAATDLPINATIPAVPVAPKSSGSVLKGTRLTIMDPRTGGDICLFYQWDDGSLRYTSQSSQHIWQGSTDLDVIDAKLGTPLASVSTGSNGSTYWFLFYVDNAEVIRNIYSANDPTTWREGNVGGKGYKVPNATNIAFTASGGISYNHTLDGIDGGVSLYATGSDGTIHEYIYDEKNGTWDNGFTFPNTDGYSGAGIWLTNAVATLYTASSGQSLELWSRDYKTISSGNSNRWQLGPSSQANLMQNGSICGQWGIAFQSASGIVQGSNFTVYGDPENTRWDTTYNISDQAPINGTAISCWYTFPAPKAAVMFQVFYQTDGSQIERAVRMWGLDNQTVPGIWKYDSVPV